MMSQTAPDSGESGPTPGHDAGEAPRPDRTMDAAPTSSSRGAPVTLCPFLATASGAWRAAFPVGDHRCTAVTPAVRIAPPKQRRLCLTPAHTGCATYLAALELRGPAGATVAIGGRVAGHRRAIPVTTPVLLERQRPALPIPATMQRGVGQIVLVGLLAIAFVAILFARLGSSPAASPGPSGSAAAVVSASPSGSPSPRSTVTLTPSPTAPSSSSIAPSPSNTPPPSVEPSPSGSGVAATQSYTVKSGDTLSGIATAFKTTVKAIAALNGLTPPYVIHPGQVLKIP